MAYQDFREFLAALRAQGELVDVNRHIALDLDVAKALRKSGATGGPALMFRDNGTPFPLVGGVYNSRAKALIAFESTEDEVFDKILTGLASPVPPVTLDTGPVHENVLTGDDIDLHQLPIPKYSPDDGGPYITPGIIEIIKNHEEAGEGAGYPGKKRLPTLPLPQQIFNLCNAYDRFCTQQRIAPTEGMQAFFQARVGHFDLNHLKLLISSLK